jgi:hypothetical protein
MFERRSRMPVGELLELRFAGNVIEEAVTTYERIYGRVCLKKLPPLADHLLRRTGTGPANSALPPELCAPAASGMRAEA